MTKKHFIFKTYGATPIKNVPTPINRFDGNPDEEDAQVLVSSTDEEKIDAALDMLNHIQVILFAILILKLICLIFKK